jgi:dephospho-CoA kinase
MKPLQIGITGGIGSGKSTICKIFQTLSIPVYDADTRAKWILGNDPEVRERIVNSFGEEAYIDGKPNKQFLASKVFNDEENLKTINSIIHPKVANDYEEWVLKNLTAPYVIKEAALLFESGSSASLDKVITVYASENIRINRVLLRDIQRSEAEVKAIISKQMSEQERQQKADYIIKNDDGNIVTTQVLKLHEKFLQMVQEKE